MELFNSEFSEIRRVHAITCQGYELGSPNLNQICILGRSELVLKTLSHGREIKMGLIDFDFQGPLELFNSEFSEMGLIHSISITCQGFDLGAPNLHQMCVLAFS